MKFIVTKNNLGWTLTPTSGPFEGQIIAVSEGVSMKDIKFAGRTLLGRIKALWGCDILVEDVYDCPVTLRALSLGHRFDVMEESLVLDYDGFLDKLNRPCKIARRVTLMGDAIYAKGAL